MAKTLLLPLQDNRIKYLDGTSSLAGYPLGNMLDQRLNRRHATNGLAGQRIAACLTTLVLGSLRSTATIGTTIESVDVHPNRRWIAVADSGANRVRIRSYDETTKTVGVVDLQSLQPVLSGATVKTAKFARGGKFIAFLVRYPASSGIRVEIHHFNDATGQIGAAISSPGSFTSGQNVESGLGALSWMLNDAGIAIVIPLSPWILFYRFDPATGTLFNERSAPGTLPTGAVNGIDFHPSAPASANTYLAVACAASSTNHRVYAYEIPLDSNASPVTGFGSVVSPGVGITSGVGYGVRWSQLGTRLLYLRAETPYVQIFPWTGSAFGAVYADPASLPAAARRYGVWSPNDTYVVLVGNAQSAPEVYKVGASAWGLRDAAFFDIPACQEEAAVITSDGKAFVSLDAANTVRVHDFDEVPTAPPEVDTIVRLSVNDPRDTIVRTRFSDRRTPGSDVVLDTEALLTASPIACVRSGTAATRINAAGKFVLAVPANTPRWMHDPTTLAAKGVIVEPAATNLCLRSEELNNGVWGTFSCTVSANAIAAPVNGDPVTADKVVEDNTAGVPGIHFFYQTLTLTGGDCDDPATYFILAKAGGRSQFVVYIGDDVALTNAIGAVFDLSGAGSVLNKFALGTGSIDLTRTRIIPFAGASGWFMCVLSGRIAVGSTDTDPLLRINLMSGGAESYAGDGSSGIHFWGSDFKFGTTLLSYIPTAGSAVTRPADVLSLTLVDDAYTMTVEGEGASTVSSFSGASFPLSPPAGKSHISKVMARLPLDLTEAEFDPSIDDTAFANTRDSFGVHVHKVLAAPIATRFVHMEFTSATLTAQGAPGWATGYWLIGKGYRVPFGYELGGDHDIDDNSTFEESRARVRYRTAGGVLRKIPLKIPIPNAVAWNTWWARFIAPATRGVFLLLLNPDDRVEMFHFGMLASFKGKMPRARPTEHDMVIDATEVR